MRGVFHFQLWNDDRRENIIFAETSKQNTSTSMIHKKVTTKLTKIFYGVEEKGRWCANIF